jgi:hypothetical protein
MKKSLNKPMPGNSKKFYNVYQGKNENNYYFFFPCIGVSQTKNLHWDMTVKSYFFAFAKWFIQYNVYEVVGDNSTELSKDCYESLKKSLKFSNMNITDIKEAMVFIKNNIYIVQILRNSNLDHPYVKKILASLFQGQSFISMD